MRHVLHVSPEVCCACRSCEVICSFRHYNECNPSRSRIHIVKMEEEDLIKPIVCRQCVNPLCMQNCPAKAINRDAKTGIVNINESLCLGCRACVDACPFGAISIDPKTSKPIKCDLCGGEPACIKVCSKKAVTYERVDVSPRLKMQAMTAKLTGKKVK